jgi:diguanylate cyclase (GGDEF)-like protein/PAS domain S-box-containing protein
MGPELAGEDVRNDALASLLGTDPGAVVVALDDDGFRIPLPDHPDLRARRTVPPPPDRNTMLELVVPADRMSVVLTWERAKRFGGALGRVRACARPDEELTIALLDMRFRYGVWLGVLARTTDVPGTAPEEPRDPWVLHVPERPRTAVLRATAHGVISAIDERVTRMLGWAPDEMVGARTIDFVHPDDHDRAIASWMEMVSTQSTARVRVRHRCRDGQWLWVEAESVFEASGELESGIVTRHLSDISDEMAAHEELRQRERLFHRLAESLPAGLVQIDADRSVVYANARLQGVLGVPADATFDRQLATVAAEDRPRLDAALAEVLADGADRRVEVAVRPGSGRERRTCLFTLVALPGEDRPGALVTVEDVTDSVRMREQLRFRATFDPLTECYNRASIMGVLDQSLAAREGTAVVFVDLDDFKRINDEFGHAAGDELLVEAARCLFAQVRDGDVVGRIGGDEFLVVCRRISGPEQAFAVADRITAALHRRIVLRNAPGAPEGVPLRASTGVATAWPGATRDDVIARADAAMYESKRLGTGSPGRPHRAEAARRTSR